MMDETSEKILSRTCIAGGALASMAVLGPAAVVPATVIVVKVMSDAIKETRAKIARHAEAVARFKA